MELLGTGATKSSIGQMQETKTLKSMILSISTGKNSSRKEQPLFLEQ